MYLDQIVVAPEHWGAGVALALLDEAKRLSPKGIDLLVNKDNFRAIGFYEKHGFSYAGEDKNPVSGIPVNRMSWRAASAAPATARAIAASKVLVSTLRYAMRSSATTTASATPGNLRKRPARRSASAASTAPVGMSRIVR